MDKQPAPLVKPILDVRVGADGIIYLKMGGNIFREHIDEFRAWAEKFKKAVVETHAKTPERTFTIIDLSELQHFDLSTSGIVYDLMRFNKDYMTRTGVWGADGPSAAVIRGMTALTRRDNFKIFPTEAEAMRFVLTGQVS